MEKLSRTQKLEDTQNNNAEPSQPMGTGGFYNANQPANPQPGTPVNQTPAYPQSFQETQPANPFALPQQPFPQPTNPVVENPIVNQPINQNVVNPLSAYEQPISPYGPQPIQQSVSAPLPNDPFIGQQPVNMPLPSDPYNQQPPQGFNQPPLQQQNFNTTIPNYGTASTSSFGHTDSIPINPQAQQSEIFDEKTDDFFDNLLKEAKQYSINQGLRTEEDTQSNVINSMVAGGVVPPATNPTPVQPYLQPVQPQPIQPQPVQPQPIQPQPVQPQPIQPQPVQPQPVQPQPQPFAQQPQPQPVVQPQPIPSAPPLSNVSPNPLSTNQADLSFENTVRMEAQQIYQNQPSIEDQLRSIDETVESAPSETLASKAYRDTNEPTVSVIPEVVPIDSNRVVFETGKIKTLESGEITTSVDGTEPPLDQMLQKKMAAETQQLQMRINEYEDELEDASTTVTYTNRVLNIILIFLILGLTVVLAFVVWWILTVRGII